MRGVGHINPQDSARPLIDLLHSPVRILLAQPDDLPPFINSMIVKMCESEVAAATAPPVLVSLASTFVLAVGASMIARVYQYWRRCDDP